jgi:ketosteroid isomerase-like protein
MAVADEAVAQIRSAFENLSPQSLARLHEVYTDDAWFKDPFNEVQGVPAIRAIFEHMFASLGTPRFVVREAVVQGAQVFLVWDMLFTAPRMGPGEQCIHGASHLLLAADGRIARHRDYWDVAEELYEKIPLLGGLMRWLKKRASS